MSVLIKGLIMPSCCDGCTFSDWSNLHQTASCKLHDYDPCFSDHNREYTDKRAEFCPLVEIPEPHGRLIDADKLKRKAQKVGTETWKMNLTAKIETTLNQFIDWIDEQPTIQPEKAQLFKEGTTSDLISKFIDGLEEIFADLRERHVDDSVCGLCEYDGAYIGQSGDWCNECPGFDRDDCFKLSDKTRKKWTEEIIKVLPTVQPEPSIPIAWIEGKIEWLNNMDNYFAELTANIIKTMLNEWRKGQTDNVD